MSKVITEELTEEELALDPSEHVDRVMKTLGSDRPKEVTPPGGDRGRDNGLYVRALPLSSHVSGWGF